MYKKILAIFSLLSVILYSGFSFGGSHNWDEVLAEAKKEGKVNWFQWYLVDAFAEFINPFDGRNIWESLVRLDPENIREQEFIDRYAVVSESFSILFKIMK